MNSQQLRIIVAAVLSVLSLVGVIMLASLQLEVPVVLAGTSTAAMAYLFGVTTNGSGLGGPTKRSP